MHTHTAIGSRLNHFRSTTAARVFGMLALVCLPAHGAAAGINTPAPTFTAIPTAPPPRTPTSTRVPCTASACPSVCGNRILEADEECDAGGTCIGGRAAGTPCHVGDATCTGGTCTTFGGQGCAANCTTESDVPYPFVPGLLNGLQPQPATSGVGITSDFLQIPLPFSPLCDAGANVGYPCTTDADCPGGACLGGMRLTIGKERHGVIPVVVKTLSVHIPVIHVSTVGLATTCISGVTARTCGGTFLQPDGKTLSPDCTAPFSDGDSVCTNAGLPPCTFLHGPGNTAHGVIGCDGLDDIDVTSEQDSGGSSGACAAPNVCPGTRTVSGHGPPGSAQLVHTLGLITSGYYTPQTFCTGEEGFGGIFVRASSALLVTGTSTAVVHNANEMDANDLAAPRVTGAPFSCSAMARGSSVGAGLVGGFSWLHGDTVGDVAVIEQFFSSAAAPCDGDCDGNGAVAIDELIRLVNIALGSIPLSACPSGDADGNQEITVDEIIAAVTLALNVCPQ